MTPQQIEDAAAALAAARSGDADRRRFPRRRGRNPKPIPIAIQDAVMRRLGERAGGWKVGYSPEGGIFCAPIYASKVHASPASLPASGFHVIGIECEIGFRVNQAFGPRARPYGRDEVLSASSLHPTIEVVDSRYQDFRSLDRLQVLADNFSNGALVYGAAASNWQGMDLVHPPIDVTADGRTLAECTGLRAGDPITLLVELVNFVANRRGGVHRRHVRHDRHAYRAGVHRARRPYSRRLWPARDRRGVVSAIGRHVGSADDILATVPAAIEDRSMNRNGGASVAHRAFALADSVVRACRCRAGRRPNCARPRCWRRRSRPARCRRSRRGCRQVPDVAEDIESIGRPGGELRMLMASPKDTRIMVVYGYARLVAYTPRSRDRPGHSRTGRCRGRPHLHAASAPRPQMVRRPAVHIGGFPLLVRGCGAATRSCRRPACRSS